MPSRLSFLQLAGLLLLAVAAALFFPTPRQLAPRWTVVVQDEQGHGLAGLPVSESWTEGLLSARGKTDIEPTDLQGSVTFPTRSGWSCLFGFGLTTVRTVVSFGLEGPRAPSVSVGSPALGLGLSLPSPDPQPAGARTRIARRADGSFVAQPW